MEALVFPMHQIGVQRIHENVTWFMSTAEQDHRDCAADGVPPTTHTAKLTLFNAAVIQVVDHLKVVLALLRFLLHFGESFLRTKAVNRLTHDGGRRKR